MKKTRKNILCDSDERWFLIFLLPFLSMFVLFTVIPIISSVFLSFFNFDMIRKVEFTGMTNYIRLLLNDGIFKTVVANFLSAS